MSDAMYGCDGCRTTIGRAGCPTHRDKAEARPVHVTQVNGLGDRWWYVTVEREADAPEPRPVPAGDERTEPCPKCGANGLPHHAWRPRPRPDNQPRLPAPETSGLRSEYVRGHWDGLNCESDAGVFGRLDECEHVGRIHKPRAASAGDEPKVPAGRPQGPDTTSTETTGWRAALTPLDVLRSKATPTPPRPDPWPSSATTEEDSL